MRCWILFFVLAALIAGAAGRQTGVLPEVQEVHPVPGTVFAASSGVTLKLPADASALVRHGGALLQEDFRQLRGIELPIAATLRAGEHTVQLGKNALPALPPPESGYDGYRLRIAPEGVVLSAATDSGLFYGLQTLRQLFDEKGTAPGCEIADWAVQRWRVCYGPPDHPEWLLPMLSRLKINMMIVESAWDGWHNWWYHPEGEELTAARHFLELAQANNIEVVPLMQGGGWAYGIIDLDPNCGEGVWVPEERLAIRCEPAAFQHPNLIRTAAMPVIITSEDGAIRYEEGRDYELLGPAPSRPFNPSNPAWRLRALSGGRLQPGMMVKADYNYLPLMLHQTPYCPSEPETYRRLKASIRRMIETYHPRFIHIGHDEVIAVNRCRRCRQRHVSNAELLGGDLQFWFQAIHAADPAITVMMWDDLAHRGKAGEEMLAKYIPEDVVLCPWSYHELPGKAQALEDRLAWLLKEHRRPVLGAAGMYLDGNALAWREALRPYRQDPRCWGFMVTNWNENRWYWSRLAWAANLMWSPDCPDDAGLEHRRQAETLLGGTGLYSTLDHPWQRARIALKLEHDDDPGAVSAAARHAEALLCGDRLPGFEQLQNPFPEECVAQSRRLAHLYRAAWCYRDCLRRPSDAVAAAALFNELFAGMPDRQAEWQEKKASWSKKHQLPGAESIFGFEIPAALPFAMEGFLRPVEAQLADTSDTVLKLSLPGVYRLAALKLPASAEVGGLEASRDGRHWQALKPVRRPAPDGTCTWHWLPQEASQLRVAGNHLMSRVAPVLLAVKPWTRWAGFPLQADTFLNFRQHLAVYPTRVEATLEQAQLCIRFWCRGKPGRASQVSHPAIYDDDCVMAFLRPRCSEPYYWQFVANAAGKCQCLPMASAPGKLPSCTAQTTADGDDWQGVLRIPLAELPAGPAEWRLNFTRVMPGCELSSWADLPGDGYYWFLQPDWFIGMSKK